MQKLGCWKTTILAMLVAAPLVTAGCGKTINERLDDTTITTRVKTTMLNDAQINGATIDVATYRGVVTLSGRVRTQAEHDQALSLARRTEGVADVKDALQIIPDGK